jgi:hypothetical protein
LGTAGVWISGSIDIINQPFVYLHGIPYIHV